MKKLLLFIIPVLVTSIFSAYFLYRLDSIVQGTLYNYGLEFSYEWANLYWNTLRIVHVCLGLTMAFSVAGSLYYYRMYGRVRNERPKIGGTQYLTQTAAIEKKPSPMFRERKREPQPQFKTPSENISNGLYNCTHCGKAFSQPLRMLDFREEHPRMISVCPFCSEVIQPITSKRR